jgi:hypothetical protein
VAAGRGFEPRLTDPESYIRVSKDGYNRSYSPTIRQWHTWMSVLIPRYVPVGHQFGHQKSGFFGVERGVRRLVAGMHRGRSRPQATPNEDISRGTRGPSGVP